MAELKTRVTEQSVSDYLAQIISETTRTDCIMMCKLMEEITKTKAKMWGNSIVGVGDYKYSYSTGKKGDWFMMGFSPRKANISLYIMGLQGDQKEEFLSRFGKHKRGKGCIYINKLADIDFSVLKEMCELSYQKLK